MSAVGGILTSGQTLLALISPEEDWASAVAHQAGRLAGRAVVSLPWGELGVGPRSFAQALEPLLEPAVRTLYVMADSDVGLRDPMAARTLRNAMGRLRTADSAWLGIQTSNWSPPNLERDIRQVPLPLPTVGELEALFEQVARESGAELGVDRARAWAFAAGGLTRLEARQLVERAIRSGWLEGARADTGQPDPTMERVRQAKRSVRWTSEALSWTPADTSWRDVGGLGALRDWLEKRRHALSPSARSFGVPLPNGILLLGVQGCGKSLCAKAVGDLWGIPLARLDLPLLFRRDVSAEIEMQRALAAVESAAPAALWIDEIDKIFSGASSSAADSASRALALLITWLQERRCTVPIVATANAVDALPPELLRKGRFDEIFFLDLPTESERSQILAIHIGRVGRDPSLFDLADIAARTEHFSGAELERVVGEALLEAFTRGEELHTRHLRMASEQTVALYETFEEPIRALREWARGRARVASSDSSIEALFR